MAHWLGLLLAAGIQLQLAVAELVPITVRPRVAAELLHDLTVEVTDQGEYQLQTTGTDPSWLIPLPPVDSPELRHVLAFEYFAPAGISEVEIFDGPPISAERQGAIGALRPAEGWVKHAVDLAEVTRGRWLAEPITQLRLDLGQRAGVSARFRNFEIRALTAAERERRSKQRSERDRKLAAAERWRNYISTRYPLRIEGVSLTPDQIVVSARWLVPAADRARWISPPTPAGRAGATVPSPAAPGDVTWGLSELAADWSAADPPRAPWQVPAAKDWLKDQFEVRVPRFDDERDRFASRWQFVRLAPDGVPVAPAPAADGQPLPLAPLSAAHYVANWSQARIPDVPASTPPSTKKGLSAVHHPQELAELQTLGVAHVTINVLLPELLSPTEIAGAPTFRFQGVTWWVKTPYVAHLDQLIKTCTARQIEVSGVLLIPLTADPQQADVMQHPEAEPAGVYAMPNLADAAGAGRYAAALAFLADRYSRADGSWGRLEHWIMHNEVDYGWNWTNMGPQPLEIYFDTLYRSMRLAAATLRRANPHGRVYISLTHRWNAEEDPQWQTYPPRTLLNLLAQCSQLEGDFAWGVAYHPYPEDLFQAATWNDQQVTFDFDTPLITIKNIEVLDRFMQTPAMLDAQGQTRPVILSEQGFHTPAGNELAERVQAAALLYTFDKIRPLPTIRAFHYHRWMDHPDEGGLLLGLRRLPTPFAPIGAPKLAWQIYQAIDTPEEEELKDEFAPAAVTAEP